MRRGRGIRCGDMLKKRARAGTLSVPLGGRQGGHHPKVDVDKNALRGDEQVARVRVGVEESTQEHLAQRALYERVDDRRGLESVSAQGGGVGEAHAVDPLHGEYAP